MESHPGKGGWNLNREIIRRISQTRNSLNLRGKDIKRRSNSVMRIAQLSGLEMGKGYWNADTLQTVADALGVSPRMLIPERGDPEDVQVNGGITGNGKAQDDQENATILEVNSMEIDKLMTPGNLMQKMLFEALQKSLTITRQLAKLPRKARLA